MNSTWSGRVFICYRHADTGSFADQVRDHVTRRFPQADVFLDITSVPPGVSYADVIVPRIRSCAVVLVLIGLHWFEPSKQRWNPRARTRLADPNDPVRLELRTALQSGVRVIPVLADGVGMPAGRALPDDVKGLATLISVSIHRKHRDRDLDALCDEIQQIDPGQPPAGPGTEPDPSRRTVLDRRTVLGLLAAAAGAGGVALLANTWRPGTEPPPATADPSTTSAPTAAPATTPAYPVHDGFRLDGSPTFDTMRERGSIVIGVVNHQPGLSESSGGDWSGFDIEIARLVAAGLGFPTDRIQFEPTSTDNREEIITARRVDLVISSFTINDDRQRLISFAGPYYTAGQAILVRADETRITGKDTLMGHHVCSVNGSAPLSRIELAQPPLVHKADIVRYPNNESCLTDLLNGTGVDAMTTDDVILIGLANSRPGQFKLVGDTFSEEPYGIGLLRGDNALRCGLNTILATAIGDGTWSRIFQTTLGRQGIPPHPPPRITLCQ